MEATRREFLQGAAGSLAGNLDYSIEVDGELSESPKKEQARYIAKSAEKRSDLYENLSYIFTVEEEALDLLEESDLNSLLQEGASRQKLREMHEQGKIRVEGNGLSMIEYDAAILGRKGLEALGDGIEWVDDTIDDSVKFFRNLF